MMMAMMVSVREREREREERGEEETARRVCRENKNPTLDVGKNRSPGRSPDNWGPTL